MCPSASTWPRSCLAWPTAPSRPWTSSPLPPTQPNWPSNLPLPSRPRQPCTCPGGYIQSNVIEASHATGIDRLLFLGSSCIYPKLCLQPICEEYLLTGPLEPTNRPYAIAKIAGIEMCWSYNRQYGTRYLAAMPANVYGPGDHYDLRDSHVLPALMRKIVEAKAVGQKTVVLWGSGTPRREFLFSDDLAEACLFLMNLEDDAFESLVRKDAPPIINVGAGVDLTIRELAERISEIVGFHGELKCDPSKPDGTPQKLMDSSTVPSYKGNQHRYLSAAISGCIAEV